ncbi:MAG: sigma-70 family RNA polymerase sigma factor [Pirellulaceae bacterium]|nr:sigma-70 family RNA polymerase sigma factor [Pirellulaceae bacterium]
MAQDSSDNSETFVQLMTEHQGRLYAYVLSLLADPDHANDVLQEANLVLWRNAAEFQLGSNFRAWAFRIAHFQVMAHRQRQLRDRLVFDDELLAVLDPAARAVDETYVERQERLTACLEKLPEAQRGLLRQRYADGLSLQAIADSVRRTANAVAQTLFRVRRTLIDCVSRLAEGGAN